MDLFDFFFPAQAQATHLRKIAARQTLASAHPQTSMQSSDELAALRTDVKFLTLVLAVILKRLAETKTLSLTDVQDLVKDFDSLDGVADGGLEPSALRGLLGLLNQDHTAPAADADAFESIAELHRRYRP